MTNTISTRPAEAAADIVECMNIDKPVMVLGSPGIGKSRIMRQAAMEYLNADELITHGKGRNFIDFRATLIDPVDLHGLPSVDKESMVARWVPMGLLPNADDASEGVLFIDEITNADQSVKGALYGLVLDRFVGEYRIPAGWRVVAAGNRVEDRASASRMPSALADRFITIVMETTVEDWIKWAINEALPAQLIAFFRLRPELLNDFDGDRAINATPRSWETVGQIMNGKASDTVKNRLIYGCVGEGAAAEFIAFLDVWRDMPNPDTVLMNPTGAAVPDTSAGKWAISTAVANRVSENTLDNMVTYLDRLDKEFEVKAMLAATTRDPELASTHEFIGWSQANQDVYL